MRGRCAKGHGKSEPHCCFLVALQKVHQPSHMMDAISRVGIQLILKPNPARLCDLFAYSYGFAAFYRFLCRVSHPYGPKTVLQADVRFGLFTAQHGQKPFVLIKG